MKILLGEDNVQARELLTKLLNKIGYSVEVAADGVELLKKLNESIDIVIIDLKLPIIDGAQTAEIAKTKLHAKQPIVAITGLSSSEITKRELFNNILHKPLDIQALLDVISKFSCPECHMTLRNTQQSNKYMCQHCKKYWIINEEAILPGEE